VGWVEFDMNTKKEIEVAVIPKGSKVQIMGCSITLLEDAKVKANQSDLDYILKEQENFYKGMGIMGSAISKT
jgi:glycerol-3-phosphate dehydrogenase